MDVLVKIRECLRKQCVKVPRCGQLEGELTKPIFLFLGRREGGERYGAGSWEEQGLVENSQGEDGDDEESENDGTRPTSFPSSRAIHGVCGSLAAMRGARSRGLWGWVGRRQ